MHVDACRATRVRGEQSEEVLDLRMSCLEQRHDELKALTDLFARADAATVEKATEAAYSLSEVDWCANIAALKAPIPPPRAPSARARVDAVRIHLEQAGALHDAGKFVESLQAAQPVVTEARALHYAPLLAEALLLDGIVHLRLDDGPGAERSLHEAFVAATEGHHERAALEISARLAYTIGALQRRYGEGRFWADVALATIQHLGNDDYETATVSDYLGTIAVEEGKLTEAVTLSQRALALLEKSGRQTTLEVMILHNLAVNLATVGRNDEALVAARRGKELCEKLEGSSHPEMAMMLRITGIVLRELKRYDEALPFLRSALAVDEQVLGPMHYRTALSHSALGHVYEQLGDYEQALASNRRAIEIIEETGIKHRLTMAPYLSVGRIELKRGHSVAAVTPLERALVIEQNAKGGPAADLAEVKFQLAQALWQSHGNSQRALTLAREARAFYAGEPRFKTELADADAWLAVHRR
jgi:tetratricopeptide (TPR) repeat protein